MHVLFQSRKLWLAEFIKIINIHYQLWEFQSQLYIFYITQRFVYFLYTRPIHNLHPMITYILGLFVFPVSMDNIFKSQNYIPFLVYYTSATSNGNSVDCKVFKNRWFFMLSQRLQGTSISTHSCVCKRTWQLQFYLMCSKAIIMYFSSHVLCGWLITLIRVGRHAEQFLKWVNVKREERV